MKKVFSPRVVLVIGIIFIAFNLRAPITGVGPIIDLIKGDLGLNNVQAGFVTTLPLLAFGLFSPFVSKISKRFGTGYTMLFGLIFIFVGELVRSYTNFSGLFVGTALMGLGIAIGNVLIPSIIKEKFSRHVGRLTSIYTTSMCVFAAMGAGLSVPMASGYGVGWRNGLALWAILAVFAMIIWLPQLNEADADPTHPNRAGASSNEKSVWTSAMAWWVTLFMGIQSLLFYSLVAWLPSIITARGMDSSFAGTMALTFQLVGLPATLVLPIIADKFKNQRLIGTVKATIYLVGMLLLFYANTKPVLICSIILLSIGQGGSISLAIAFISLRTPHARLAAELSGMAQSVGYLFAAIGPILLGVVYEITGSWDIPILILVASNILLFFFVLKAGRDRLVQP